MDSTDVDPATHNITVYVEGIKLSGGAHRNDPTKREGADVTLHLNWSNSKGESKSDMDRVELTVYQVKGPANVPGYASYHYTAVVPGAKLQGTWTTPEKGELKSANGDECQILWSGGPDIGFAIFKPSDHFECRRDVNIVQVELNVAGSTIQVQNPPSQVDGVLISVDGNGNSTRTPISKNTILSWEKANWDNDPGFTMIADIPVTAVKGPKRDGKERGLRYIEIGFIQVIKPSKWCGEYNFPSGVWQRYALVAPARLDGNTGSNVPKAGNWPWYDTTNYFNSYQGSGKFSYINFYDLNAAPTSKSNIRFRAQDTPELPVVDNLTLDEPETETPTTATCNRFDLHFDFNLYFAVHSLDVPDVNDLKDVNNAYVQRAQVDWHFDGSGKLTGGVWSPDLGDRNGPGDTSAPDGHGNVSVVEVNTGDIVPLTRPASGVKPSRFNAVSPSFDWRRPTPK